MLRYLDILLDMVVSGLDRFTDFPTAYNKQANAQTLHLLTLETQKCGFNRVDACLRSSEMLP